MKKVAYHTLGCKLNFSETSSISEMLEAHGYIKVNFDDTPDIFIINTCSVTENADKKCQKVVREAKKISPQSYVCLIGCYAQLKPQQIIELSGVDSVLGTSEKFELLDKLENFSKKGIYTSNINLIKKFIPSYSGDDRTRTFLKIQDGCNYGCSFCTIPLARGKNRSATIASIVKQAKEIINNKCKEIILTGVNIGDFGIIEGTRKQRFVDLIHALDALEGEHRYRISSIEPNLLTPEIIALVGKSKKIVPHFHIPLQSGSDLILQKMKRRYDTSHYRSIIEKINELIPHCSIGVDVIVGFPGEDDLEFQKTYDFLHSLDISYLHVFPYSERPNTLAIQLNNMVPHTVRTERSEILRKSSEEKKRTFYLKNINTERTVLFEKEKKNGRIHGFTENYIKVTAPAYKKNLINQFTKVKLSRIESDSFII